MLIEELYKYRLAIIFRIRIYERCRVSFDDKHVNSIVITKCEQWFRFKLEIDFNESLPNWLNTRTHSNAGHNPQNNDNHE